MFRVSDSQKAILMVAEGSIKRFQARRRIRNLRRRLLFGNIPVGTYEKEYSQAE